MNKKDLISKTTELLRECDKRKPVSAQKTVLHISDDYGNQSDFTVRKTGRGLLYTASDVTTIIDACLAVIEDSVKHGEDISIHGFGTLGVQYRSARQTKHPDTGEVINIDARYVPKFNFGNTLRMAAKVYELSLADKEDGE